MLVEKFTPEVLISAPRRGAAVPNHDGTLALYTQSTHTVGGSTIKEIRVMNIDSGESRCLFDDPKAFDAAWLGDGSNTFIFLKGAGDGLTMILTVDADESPPLPRIVGHIPAAVRGLKVRALADGSIAFTVVGLVDSEGKLFNAEADKKPHTGRVYDNFDVRVWTKYKPTQKYTIWYSTLAKNESGWDYSGDFHNALRGTTLEAPPNMNMPGDPRDMYDLSHGGIVFIAEDNGISDPLLKHASDVYLVPLDSFAEAAKQCPKKITVQSEDRLGVCQNPRFGPDGCMIAFIRNPVVYTERAELYIYHHESQYAVNVFDMVTGKRWPLTPSGFEFSRSGHFLYITAQDCGRVGLYKLNLQPNAYPETLLRNGSVTSCHPLGCSGEEEMALVTSSSFIESSLFQIIDGDPTVEPVLVSSASRHGADLGLSLKQVSEFYYEGGGDYCVHSWMVKPRNFEAGKKYPLAVLVHGGPLKAWLDSWNLKWNAAVWAEQGYVVVMPNITGSTGYGLDFAGAVRNNWGGRAYDDLVSCMEYLSDVPGVDIDNAVIAGASFGGYMVNWIQGQPLGRRFKAMVSHGGLFHIPAMMLQTDHIDREGFFGDSPLLWKNPSGLDRYSPARPELLRNWKTPMLVVHGDRDYMCPITEGLAAFHALQALGIRSRFLTFADEGHWVVGEENSLEWHSQVFAWINEYTGIAAGGDGRA